MRLKIDQNLGETVAALLRSAGHDVATVPDQRLEGSPDRHILDACRAEGRCLVTLDLDFSNPFVFDPTHLPGIAVLRVPERHTVAALTAAVETLIRGLAAGPVHGQLWTIQAGRIRRFAPAPRTDTKL